MGLIKLAKRNERRTDLRPNRGNTESHEYRWWGVPRWVYVIAFSLITAGSMPASAQCDPAGLGSLPSYNPLPNPHGALSSADLRRRLQALASDVTPTGLWQRAQLEFSLAKSEPSAHGEAIRHLAMIVQGWSSNPRQNGDPDEGEVLHQLATALAARGDNDQARQVFHRLIRAHPNHRLVAAAYLSFAEYYTREGDVVAAGRFLERVESLSPSPLMRAVVRYLRFYSQGRTSASESRSAIEQMLVATRSPQSQGYLAHLRAHCH